MPFLSLLDCHVHLSSPQFEADREAVISRAQAAGVKAMLACACGPEEFAEVLALQERHVTLLRGCVEEARAKGLPVAALGEIGLDFSKRHLEEAPPGAKAAQLALFEAHLDLAEELELPVNVHSRGAERECVQRLARRRLRGVLHAFKGEATLAVELAATRRFVFSFPPATCYKWEYQEAIKALPLEALALETDAPSLGAKGPRERNEPCRIVLAAAKMAELRGLSVPEIAEATTANALRVLGGPVPGLRAALQLADGAGGSKAPARRWRPAKASDEFVAPERGPLREAAGAEAPPQGGAAAPRNRWAARRARDEAGGLGLSAAYAAARQEATGHGQGCPCCC